MEEEKVIQLSLSLPVSELGRLAALVSQVSDLLSGESGSGLQSSAATTTTETAESRSDSFDPARFQALWQSEAEVRRGEAALSDTSVAARGEVLSPETAAEAVQAAGEVSDVPEVTRGGVELAAVAEAAVAQAAIESAEVQVRDAAEVQTEAETYASQAQAELSASEAALERDATVWQEAAEVLHREGAVSQSVPSPVRAQAEISETSGGSAASGQSRNTAGQERGASSGPSAEEVSLAFRRDDRRYDNGFPLY
jgi:hypothetical protein